MGGEAGGPWVDEGGGVVVHGSSWGQAGPRTFSALLRALPPRVNNKSAGSRADAAFENR
jgi:hypothetical protein